MVDTSGFADYSDEQYTKLLDEPEAELTEVTRRRLNFMIAAALLNPDERINYEMKTVRMTEIEGQKLCKELEEFMPIEGFHTIPIRQYEITKAVRFAVMIDDFKEKRWKK